VGGNIAFLRDIYSYLELGQGSDVPRQHVVSKCKSLIASNQMGSVEKQHYMQNDFCVTKEN